MTDSKAGKQRSWRTPGRSKRKTLDELREKLMQESPSFRVAWEALEPKRRIVSALLPLRARANLTQKELARRAGWSPAYVCRLESFPREGEKLYMPDLASLTRYASACGYEVAVVFGRAKGRGAGIEISETLYLGERPRFEQAVAALRHSEISVRGGRVEAVRAVERDNYRSR